MIRFKNPKINFKFNKKNIAISSILSFIILIFIIPNNFSASIGEILSEGLAFIVRCLAGAVDTMISTKMDSGINKLVFNITGDMKSPTMLTDFNLSLLRGNALSKQLFQLYNLFVYVGGSLLGVIGLWVTFDFIKTANDIKHKAMLKQRLTKLVVSIVLLVSVPYCFDILMVINQAICDIFRLFVVDVIGGSEQSQGAALTNIFKDLAENNSGDLVYALLYLMSSLINVWLVVFYMIRDLTIAFLFMVAPVIVILLPYRTDLVLKWVKELCSNIFTQAVQAFVFCVIVAIAAGIGEGTLYDKVFALVAFGMFIPLTATVKKMLGIEGEVGAAKSNAGLGAAIAAGGLASAVGIGALRSGGKIKDSIKDISNIRGEEKNLKNSKFEDDSENSSMGATSLSSSEMSGANKVGGSTRTGGRGIGIDPNNRTATNRNHNIDTEGEYDSQGGYSASSRARQLKGMKRNAKKEIAKTMFGGIAGASFGGAMAVGSSVYGSPMASMMAAKGGSSIGNAIGNAGAGALHDGATLGAEKVEDLAYGEGFRYDGENAQSLDNLFSGTQRPSSPFDIKTMKENFSTIKNNHNQNLGRNNRETVRDNKERSKEDPSIVTGVDSNAMSSGDYKKENKAILKRNQLERRGKFDTAHRSYASNTYNRNNEVPQNDIANEQLSSPMGSLNGKREDPILSSSGNNPNPLPSPSSIMPIIPSMSGSSLDRMPFGFNNLNMDTFEISDMDREISGYGSNIETPTMSSTNQKSQSYNSNPVEDLDNSVQDDINIQMQEHMNNQSYLEALESCRYDAPSMFLENDYGQLM